jgi:hypothetical protein
MAFAHSFPIDGTKPQDDDAIFNEYPGPFELTAAATVNFQEIVHSVRQHASAG